MRFRRAVRLAFTVALAASCRENLGTRASGFVAVGAGDRFTCALAADGSAWCWGAGTFGQLGTNTTVNLGVPTAVAGGLAFRTLAVGNSHACGIAQDGALWCWGLDDYDELGGQGGRCNVNVPFAWCSRVPVAVVGGRTFDSVVAAAFTTCAMDQGGAAWCWGLNDHGQLGTGELVGGQDTAPTPVQGGRVFRSVTLDINHACALAASGGLFCWGSNDFGQLAADTSGMPRCGTGAGFYCVTSPVASAAGLGFQSVSAGSTHTCALTPAGAAVCWGSNEYGTLGNPSAPGGLAPVAVSGGLTFTQISAGLDHTCALDGSGAAWCWGVNTWGQLGTSASTDVCSAFGSADVCSKVPAAVQGAPALIAVSAGSEHSCGVTASGEVWCWGRGIEGQLGDGQVASSVKPVRVVHP